MNAIVETVRGLWASIRWIAGVPLLNARVTYLTESKTDARAIYIRHCQRFLDTCHIRVELSGEFLPEGQGCVLCHNESSFPDLMAYLVTMLEHANCAAAADIYRVFPFARGAFEKIDFHMVQRGNRSANDALMEQMIARLRNGERVIWGGEGRLSGIDGVLRFKIGAGLIAIRAGVPVIPIAIHGGHMTMPLWSVRARPGTIRIRLGEPVSTKGLTENDARALADDLQARVALMYRELAQQAEG
jgi:1-acyl-sn-glycerol-3-phosphate acyltransferase